LKVLILGRSVFIVKREEGKKIIIRHLIMEMEIEHDEGDLC